MIRQRIYSKKYDWRIYVYYIVTEPDAEEIMSQLRDIGCYGKNISQAYSNLSSGKLDTGLTYTNQSTQESVVVIAKTSTALQYLQSLTHEFGHLSNHIAQAYDIPLKGEEVRYICDGLLAQTWEISKELLCDCCRTK